MNTRASRLHAQLLQYKLYHHQRTNVRIHMVFVPVILFSAICVLHRGNLGHAVTAAHLYSAGCSLYYVSLCVLPGLLASSLFALLNWTLDKECLLLSISTEVKLFLLGWVALFIGHGYFERRRPALVDNLVQSLVTAPYFVLFELLFKLGFFAELNEDLERGFAASRGTLSSDSEAAPLPAKS